MAGEMVSERRQRAREAGQDVICSNFQCLCASEHAEAAIETATRVRITEEAIEAFDVERNGSESAGNIREGLRGALEALGFEVEE